MRVAVIGYGKMGKLFHRILRERYEVGIFSQVNHSDFSSLEEAYLNSDVVIIASSIRETIKRVSELKKIANKNPRRCIIFDISTFKEELIPLYYTFPREVNVASVHPMFGPGVRNFEGKRFLVVPVENRKRDAIAIEKFLKELGGDTRIVELKEHERTMGFVLGVPYFLGIAYLQFSYEKGLHRLEGTSHRFLSIYGKAALNDSTEMIEEILNRSLTQISEFLEFLKRENVDLEKLKKMVSQEEIKDAYARFYRALEH